MKQIIVILLIVISGQVFAQNFEKLAIGKRAEDFKLRTITGDEVQLNKINSDHPLVLVVQRGWPGYQCPICTKQVGSLVGDEDKFSELNVAVLMVYPGPSDELQKHAEEFSEDFRFPDNFYFVLDPDYSMINKYGLRWNEPKETAYPSTFVIDKKGKIVFSRISTSHGGRASNEEIFKAIEILNSAK